MTIVGQKDVSEAIEQSLQPRATERVHTGVTGLLNYLAAGSYRVAPWWSPQRDIDLDTFWKDGDHLSGSLALLTAKVVTVPVQVQPRDTRLKKNMVDAERFNIILNEEADFGKGFVYTLSKWLSDYWSADNGAFLEIIGPGDPLGPIEGEPTGIAHLDSHRIQRTGNQEYPAIYFKPDGGRVKFHATRIAMTSDMPSAREEMFGVGFCATSRAIHNSQRLMDIATYSEEKLGSRPKRGILVAKGISTDVVLASMAIADEQMDNRALSIYSQLAVLGDIPVDADLSLLDLIGLPDGFDEETSTRLGMFAIATAFGVPIRWIWPASVSGATKADAMYQHIAGLGGGIGRILTTLTMLLGGDPRGVTHSMGKFLPPHLKLVFDFQDDEQDKMRADVQKTRSENLQTNLDDGVYDMRTAREQSMTSGDVTKEQFNRMEMEDGRLPDGSPILSLFHVTQQPFLGWLDLVVANPLATSDNDPLQMLAEIDMAAINIQDVIANSSHATTKAKADQALAALSALKALYAPLAQQAVQADIMARFGTPAPVEDEPVVEDEKSFDYGVSVGEIIGGELARGTGGRFVSVEELKEQIRAGMLARMGGASAQSAVNSAATKRAANRAKIAEALGIDTEGLAGMIDGTATPEQERALAAAGLATIGPDGAIFLNPNGRKLLGAANSGDVDAAEAAIAKAKQAEAEPKGKVAKPSAEERQRQREEAQRKLRDENRAAVAEQVVQRLDQADFTAMMQFSEGRDPDPAQQQALAQAGLLEVDADGNSRMTAVGQRFVNAADKGDVRSAKDALSAGQERVCKLLERAAHSEATAAQYDSNVTVSEQNGEQRAAAYVTAAEQMQGEIAGVAAPYNEQAAGLDIQAQTYTQRGTTLDAQAADLDAQADAAQAAVGTAQTVQQRARAEQRVEELRVRASQAREQADAERDRATEFRTQGLTLREQGREVRSAMETRMREYLAAADDARTQGANMADQWRDRAAKLRQQISEWRDSVGNASLPARPLKALREFFTKQAVSPIPTQLDIESAIRVWDANPDIPDEAKGILEAERIES